MRPTPKIWRLSWRLVICAALLLWIFHNIFLHEGRLTWESTSGRSWDNLPRSEQWQIAWTHGPVQLGKALTAVHPAAFGLSLLFMAFTILLGVWRWRLVLAAQALYLPFSRALEISLVAHFFNSFLLGSTGGDLMKAYYTARESHHKKTETVTTVFVDRLLGLWAMLLFGGILAMGHWRLVLAEDSLLALGWLILIMLIGCTVVVYLAFWGGLSRPMPKARSWLRRLPKGHLLERSLEACRHFGRNRMLLFNSLLLSMALNLACVLQVWAIAKGLSLQIPTSVLFMIVPMIICVSALPITPSGLGVRENLFVFTLASASLGVDETMALSLSLLTYAGSLFWSLIGGLLYVTFKHKHHLEEIAHES